MGRLIHISRSSPSRRAVTTPYPHPTLTSSVGAVPSKPSGADKSFILISKPVVACVCVCVCMCVCVCVHACVCVSGCGGEVGEWLGEPFSNFIVSGSVYSLKNDWGILGVISVANLPGSNVSIVAVVQLLSPGRLCDPMGCSTPGSPVLHCLLEFAQLQGGCQTQFKVRIINSLYANIKKFS